MTTNHAPNLDDALDKEGEELAQKFAKNIPDSAFSPADLQGYLITARDCPRTAAEGIEAWVKEKLEGTTVQTTVAAKPKGDHIQTDE
ncbi:hypothetical protein CSUB01_03490 [Colletotrichum sublineola]|uniref:Mitochondrial chaperone BCS1-like ATPase lid domain-containing protein n=1 Tax=Colletotrichum sublineola TaxID=1173701 RepID=A0A066X2U5_COLSU|nr:hypothetical protein CSUB01_03490 [Colletotrichum sublineola]